LKTEKNDAETKMKNAEKRRDWYRFQANLYRAYMGHPVTNKTDVDLLKEHKKQFDDDDKDKTKPGKLPFADGDDVAEVTKLIKETLNPAMPWDAEKSDAPSTTYEQRLRDRSSAIGAVAKSADDAAAAQRKAEEERATEKTNREAAEKQRDTLTKNNE